MVHTPYELDVDTEIMLLYEQYVLGACSFYIGNEVCGLERHRSRVSTASNSSHIPAATINSSLQLSVILRICDVRSHVTLFANTAWGPCLFLSRMGAQGVPCVVVDVSTLS